MHPIVKERKHVQSKYQVEIIFNVQIKNMHQHIFLLNTLVHKVNSVERRRRKKSNNSSFLFLSVVHTMCADKEPIRNTLYGFIVSPAYPHPMADNLKCSINIGSVDLISI